MKDDENAITEEALMNLCESQFYEECGKNFDGIAQQGFADIDKSMHKDLHTYICLQLHRTISKLQETCSSHASRFCMLTHS